MDNQTELSMIRCFKNLSVNTKKGIVIVEVIDKPTDQSRGLTLLIKPDRTNRVLSFLSALFLIIHIF